MEDVAREEVGVARGDGHVRIAAVVVERDAEGGNVVHTGFERGSHGAGIDDGDGGVDAVVDARNDKRGATWGEGVDCHFHAVGRGAIAFIDGQAGFVHCLVHAQREDGCDGV